MRKIQNFAEIFELHAPHTVFYSYVMLQDSSINLNGKKLGDAIEWLPCHSDPSLISVIIHDAPEIQSKAMGLQYQQSFQNKWDLFFYFCCPSHII